MTESMRLHAMLRSHERRARKAGVAPHRWKWSRCHGELPPVARCICGALAWLPRGKSRLLFDVGGETVIASLACPIEVPIVESERSPTEAKSEATT